MLTAQQNLEAITTRQQLNQLNQKITTAASPQQLDALLAQYLDTTVKLQNLLALRLQSNLQNLTKVSQTMSNILKAQHDRANSTINNIK